MPVKVMIRRVLYNVIVPIILVVIVAIRVVIMDPTRDGMSSEMSRTWAPK